MVVMLHSLKVHKPQGRGRVRVGMGVCRENGKRSNLPEINTGTVSGG